MTEGEMVDYCMRWFNNASAGQQREAARRLFYHAIMSEHIRICDPQDAKKFAEEDGEPIDKYLSPYFNATGEPIADLPKDISGAQNEPSEPDQPPDRGEEEPNPLTVLYEQLVENADDDVDDDDDSEVSRVEIAPSVKIDPQEALKPPLPFEHAPPTRQPGGDWQEARGAKEYSGLENICQHPRIKGL